MTQSETQELKPCPLCGSADLFLRDIAGWELDCRGCELSLVLADDPSRDGLIARWNTRAPIDDAATQMRTACVEKVKSRLAVLEKQTSESQGISRACCEGRDAAIREILRDVESVTLDQVKQK